MSELAVVVEPDEKKSGVVGTMSEENEEKAERLRRWSVRIRRVVIVLAALEQAATYLAQIAFVGATVVLLGGYATRLKPYDFKLISALLLSEGVRVFLASQNAEYTRVIGGRFAGNWGPGIFVGPWLIAAGYFTMGKQTLIIPIFQALQVGSAAVTFAFSLSRLKSGNYKPTLMSSPSDAGELANFVFGIRLFYILTLVELSVFLVVKVLAWELLPLLLHVAGKIENGDILHDFAGEIYGVFLREGFGKASATNFFTFISNRILQKQDLWYFGRGFEGLQEGILMSALEVLRWQLHQEDGTRENIKSLIRLTAPGQLKQVRHCANRILATVVLFGRFGSERFVLAVSEFGRIPLEVVDVEVIEYLHRIVWSAPSGFLPVQAVSNQASTFLIRSIFEGDDDIKAQAALTFLTWWTKPSVYVEYGFDPADIFYRLYIDRRRRVGVGKDLDLEAAFEYEAIAEPIKTVFSQALTPPRSDVMNKLLRRVDFRKLKNKQSTINLSGIVAEVIVPDNVMLDDRVVGLVAAWIWFMDESTFEKAISNLTKEELGMLKKDTLIYSAILRSKPYAFSI